MKNLLTDTPLVGAYVSGRSGLVTANAQLSFTFETTEVGTDTRLLKLKIKNLSERPINLNSFVVGDFEISANEITEILENGWGQSSFSGYRQIWKPSQKARFFLQRDQNAFSFDPEYGYLSHSMINEWYTQLVSKTLAVVIGAVTTKDQFAQVYIQKKADRYRIRLTSQLDGLALLPGQEITSETFAIVVGSKHSSLEKFGQLLQKFGEVRSLPKPPVGLCCGYYHQGNVIDEKYIMEQLETLDKLPGRLTFDYIQIDAGYSVCGDWLETRQQFPRGMEFIVKEIKKRGYQAGIWLAPFVASPQSQVFKQHPDWFLKNDRGQDFEARFTSPVDFLPALQFRVLDVTHPEVTAHLTKIVTQLKHWGFSLIKTDFTYPVGFNTHYRVPMTRAQALRTGFTTLRKAAGKEMQIMSAITQLSPLVGLVDSVRVGLDSVNPFVYRIPVINQLVNHWMLNQDLRNAEARQFLNGKVWINDADCFVTYPEAGFSQKMLRKHAAFLESYGGARWIGDHLGKLGWNAYENYLSKVIGFIPQKTPAIAIVLPAWNEEKTLQQTLNSAIHQHTCVPYEVVVVDNNSTDNTAKIAKTFAKNIRVVMEKHQGIGAARQTGFEAVTSPLIASTDADTILPPNWIHQIFGEFWNKPQLVGLVGTYRFTTKTSFFNFWSRIGLMIGDWAHFLLARSFAFRGLNFAVTKKAWEKSGGFNTNISALEDVELSLRVGKLGHIHYAPQIVIETTYRRFEGRFIQQLVQRLRAYYYRVILRDASKLPQWDVIR